MVDGWYRLCLHVMGTICYKHVFKSLCIDRTPPPPAINHLVSNIDRSMLDASEPTIADELHAWPPPAQEQAPAAHERSSRTRRDAAISWFNMHENRETTTTTYSPAHSLLTCPSWLVAP